MAERTYIVEFTGDMNDEADHALAAEGLGRSSRTGRPSPPAPEGGGVMPGVRVHHVPLVAASEDEAIERVRAVLSPHSKFRDFSAKAG